MATVINLDFGPQMREAPASYGAAGEPGFWNNPPFSTEVDFPTHLEQYFPLFAGEYPGLIDNTGSDSRVWMATNGLWDLVNDSVASNELISEGDRALLADYMFGTSPSLWFEFSRLVEGEYQVLVYGAGRQDNPRFVKHTVTGTSASEAVITGVYNGGLFEGHSYSSHRVHTVDGRIRIDVQTWTEQGVLGRDDAVINGIQLIAVPEPTTIVGLAGALLIAFLRRSRVRW